MRYILAIAAAALIANLVGCAQTSQFNVAVEYKDVRVEITPR